MHEFINHKVRIFSCFFSFFTSKQEKNRAHHFFPAIYVTLTGAVHWSGQCASTGYKIIQWNLYSSKKHAFLKHFLKANGMNTLNNNKHIFWDLY